MIKIDIVDINTLIAFWLCFTRWLGILMQLPLFDDIKIPVLVKSLAAITISFAFFDYVKAPILNDISIAGRESFWILTIYQLCVGMLVGLVVRLIMNIFTAAGSIMSQQIGFIAMRYFDPSSTQVVGPIEILLKWSMVIMVLFSGALLPMFKGGHATFFTMNLEQFRLFDVGSDFYINFVKDIFLSAMLLATPIIFSNIFIMCVMGIIARVVPQMNVLMISFVVNIGVGLFVLSLTSNEFLTTAFKMYTDRLGDWFKLIT